MPHAASATAASDPPLRRLTRHHHAASRLAGSSPGGAGSAACAKRLDQCGLCSAFHRQYPARACGLYVRVCCGFIAASALEAQYYLLSSNSASCR